MTSRSANALLSRLEVKYGPHELLSQFFMKAIQSINERGISLRVTSFSELEEINLRNSESWRPLFPSFSPSTGGVKDKAGYAIVGDNHTGDTVATQAVRVFEWQDTHLKAEAESLRMMYADPGTAARPGEECRVTADIAKDIRGRVSLGGAIWYHPDYRRMQLPELFTRITRAYAYVTYGVDQHIGFLAPDSVTKRIHIRSGFRETGDAMVMTNSLAYPDTETSMTILRMWPSDIIDDAYLHLAHWRSKSG